MSRGYESAHEAPHLLHRSNWLRAAVLGANDGIISTASLLAGVAAAGAGREAIVVAGVAGLTAGAFAMAAGEYVSVASQRDVERADLEREAYALSEDPAGEARELASIWEGRGLPRPLAEEVAAALTARDALEAHARDELGLSEPQAAKPLQASLASAASFAAGAAAPLAAAAAAPAAAGQAAVAAAMVALAALGWLGARAGGAPAGRATGRVLLLGALAMGATAAIGRMFGVALG